MLGIGTLMLAVGVVMMNIDNRYNLGVIIAGAGIVVGVMGFVMWLVSAFMDNTPKKGSES
jgi:hypothetical protein